MKKLVTSLLLSTYAAFAFGQGNVNVINPTNKPVPTFLTARAGATNLTSNFYSGHITTAATTSVTSTTCYVSTVVISCTNAGTGFTITVRSKEGTPTVLYSGTLALGTITPISVALPGVVSGSGLEIVTAGTPGVVDVKINYAQ
jgi:hypothetical protein